MEAPRITTHSANHGCRHCLSCRNLGFCRQQHAEEMEFWPAGLNSPTVYYMLRERQLAYNYRAAAAQGAQVWRQRSVADGEPARLLQRRGRPQLALRLPQSFCNVQRGEVAVYVRALAQPAAAAPRSTPAAHSAAAAAAAHPAVAPCLERLATPPQLNQGPAPKRTRLSLEREAGHLIARAARSPAGSARPTVSARRRASPHERAASSPCHGADGAGNSPLAAFLRRFRGMMGSPAAPPQPVAAH